MGSTPRVLFVCLGNICRSPMADGVMRAKAAAAGLSVIVDGAGTGGWHIGAAPDPRAVKAAAQRGFDLSTLRARQFSASDFAKFDLIIAMDQSNRRNIETLRPNSSQTPVILFQDVLGHHNQDVPDPYYDGRFDQVLDLIEAGCEALITRLQIEARA